MSSSADDSLFQSAKRTKLSVKNKRNTIGTVIYVPTWREGDKRPGDTAQLPAGQEMLQGKWGWVHGKLRKYVIIYFDDYSLVCLPILTNGGQGINHMNKAHQKNFVAISDNPEAYPNIGNKVRLGNGQPLTTLETKEQWRGYHCQTRGLVEGPNTHLWMTRAQQWHKMPMGPVQTTGPGAFVDLTAPHTFSHGFTNFVTVGRLDDESVNALFSIICEKTRNLFCRRGQTQPSVGGGNQDESSQDNSNQGNGNQANQGNSNQGNSNQGNGNQGNGKQGQSKQGQNPPGKNYQASQPPPFTSQQHQNVPAGLLSPPPTPGSKKRPGETLEADRPRKFTKAELAALLLRPDSNTRDCSLCNGDGHTTATCTNVLSYHEISKFESPCPICNGAGHDASNCGCGPCVYCGYLGHLSRNCLYKSSFTTTPGIQLTTVGSITVG